MHLSRSVLGTSDSDSICQILESGDGRLPVDAGIGDGDTLLESRWTLGWNLLVALVDVGLNHNTDDGVLSGAKLVTNDLGDTWLVAVVLVGVTWIEC